MPSPEILCRGAAAFGHQPIRPAQRRPFFHFVIAKFPRPSPCGPTPDVTKAREVITLITGRSEVRGIEIRAADHRDLSIFRVTVQQFLAERKEAWMGKTVVLEDNRPLHLTEDPIQTFGNISSKAAVRV